MSKQHTGWTGIWKKNPLTGDFTPDPRERMINTATIMQMFEDPTDPSSRMLSIRESLERPLIGTTIYYDGHNEDLESRLVFAFIADRLRVPAEDEYELWNGHRYERVSIEELTDQINELRDMRFMVPVETTLIPDDLMSRVSRITNLRGSLIFEVNN